MITNIEILKSPTKGLKREAAGLYNETLSGTWVGYERTSFDGVWEMWVNKTKFPGTFSRLATARVRARFEIKKMLGVPNDNPKKD